MTMAEKENKTAFLFKNRKPPLISQKTVSKKYFSDHLRNLKTGFLYFLILIKEVLIKRTKLVLNHSIVNVMESYLKQEKYSAVQVKIGFNYIFLPRKLEKSPNCHGFTVWKAEKNLAFLFHSHQNENWALKRFFASKKRWKFWVKEYWKNAFGEFETFRSNDFLVSDFNRLEHFSRKMPNLLKKYLTSNLSCVIQETNIPIKEYVVKSHNKCAYSHGKFWKL